MGGLQYAGFIIPILLLLVAIEYMISRRKNVETYRFSDTIVNMSCGILERMFDLFYVVLLYFIFDFLSENFALTHIPQNAFTWILALLVADFLAYWHHRLSHEINFMWASHIVHHQSEELNLTTVFRVSAFAVINRSFFFIWMPLAGFSPAFTTSAIVFIGLYQFVTHTRLVGKLGFLEYIFVTPSSHRVHHGRNEKYLDKNYGHVFIFWDRLLGTYEEEDENEEVEFGITTGFESSNPYWAYLHYWVDLFKRASKMDNFMDKVRVFLMPPTWAPESLPLAKVEYEVDATGKRKKYRLDVPVRLQLYVLFNILLTVGGFMYLTFQKAELSALQMGLLIATIAISVLTQGLLMERKKWALNTEYIRLGVSAALVSVVFAFSPYNWIIIPVLLLVFMVFAFWAIRMRDYFGVEIRNPEPVM
ncbi:MAG: sterol desaturase family protein [Bacteroidetes bacterium]|nr:sterol desaturase family protein [Bacteroidota bacterium]